MDMRETSAMTEASGLVDDPEGAGLTSGAGPLGGSRARPQDVAMRWAVRLRKVTVKAPLQSLFVAFLLGVWVARRR
jgi:hypothetical protein